MRRYPKLDVNHNEILRAARDLGATTQSLASIGDGCPDAVIGYKGHNLIIEIKNGGEIPSRRKLTEDEERWHSDWRGQVAVVESVDDLMELLNGHP